jgi:hypothetical protein
MKEAKRRFFIEKALKEAGVEIHPELLVSTKKIKIPEIKLRG